MDDHRSLHPALSITRATSPSITGSRLRLSWLGGQQGARVLTVAHDLHLDVAEVRQALVIGGFLPQPDVRGLGAAQHTAESRERTGRWVHLADITGGDIGAVPPPSCSRHPVSPDLKPLGM